MTKQILIIDDDESVRDAFTLALEDGPYKVTTATCGEEGVEMAASVLPTMIFLDLKMPGIDGVETLRQIRKKGLDMPVYIVTAFMPEFLKELAVAAQEGLQFGLGQKPLSGEQIRLIVKGNIENSPGASAQ